VPRILSTDVERSGPPAVAWRVYGAVTAFLLLYLLTDPWQNWPAAVAIAGGWFGLNWWRRHRLWHGETEFEDGRLLFTPPITLLPETYLAVSADLVDRQGRSRPLWETTQAIPPGLCRDLGIDLVWPGNESHLAGGVFEAEWHLVLYANTPQGKLEIRWVLSGGKDDGPKTVIH
jgi:hypothetical protein